MKYFVLVSVIFAFFIFNLSDCKGKKEDETQISQQVAQTDEDVKKADLKPKEEIKLDEKSEEVSQKKEIAQKEIKEEKVEKQITEVIKKAESEAEAKQEKKTKGLLIKDEDIQEIMEEEEVELIQWDLDETEEADVPKFIWERKIKKDYIDEIYLLSEEKEKKLIEENPSLSKILSDKSVSPFFLLKGKNNQYLIDIKGSIKEIPHPSSEMVIVFDKKAKKVTGKTRGGEVLWDREWETLKYERAQISPDGSWAILRPYETPEYGYPEGEHIVAIDKDGKEFWRFRISIEGYPRFSKKGKKLIFGDFKNLYYATKEKILWKKTYRFLPLMYRKKISPSGDLILLPDIDLHCVSNNGLTRWRVNDRDGLHLIIYIFSKNENFLFIIGKKEIPEGSIALSKPPLFVTIVDTLTGKLIKKTKNWIKSSSPFYEGIIYASKKINYENKYLLLCNSRGSVPRLYLYDISHILK